jgi:peptide/nickel transport system substrate-binding protein
LHRSIPRLVEQLKKNPLHRREFLRTTTLLGLSATAAYKLASEVLGEDLLPEAHAQEPAQSSGQVLRVAMPVLPINDPATYDETNMANITHRICESLTVTDSSGITRPQLAERWEASEDLRTWTIHLRRDAQWHSGEAFDVDDVIFNITRWLDPDLGSANLGSFAALTETYVYGGSSGTRMRSGALERVDRFTLRLHLSQPTLSIPENFSAYFTGMVHRDFNGNFAEKPNGTGPYRLAEYEQGSHAILKRSNRPYWGAQPSLDEIHYYDVGGNVAEMMEAYVTGEVDMVHSVDVRSLRLAQSVPDTTVYEIKSASTGVARMRVTEAPFDDINVRQAVQACIDPISYPQLVFSGRGSAAEHHHVAPIHPEYFEADRPVQDYERAKRLLRDAGYPNGLDITIDVGNTNGTWQQYICEIMKDQLAPAGINLTVNVLEKSDYWARWKTTPFGLTTWGHRSLGTMVLGLAYRTGVPWNEVGYANPEFDAALDHAESLIDIDERTVAMEKVQGILQRDAIMVQPVWRPAFFVARNYVNNLIPDPSRLHRFDEVTITESSSS